MRRVLFLAALLLLLGFTACAPEGSTAYVSFNIPPTADCTVVPSSGGGKFIPVGTFDIGHAQEKASYCRRSYYLNLLINSNLRTNAKAAIGRSEPNILQIHSAEVRLMNLQKATIEFKRGKTVLPNPFLVVTNNTLQPSTGTDPSIGVVPIDAIPVDYAAQLDEFTGQQILAEVQIFGTTLGDVDVDFKPFVYPIELCSNCLYRCLDKLTADSIDPESLYGDDCADDAGADGRVCIDPNPC